MTQQPESTDSTTMPPGCRAEVRGFCVVFVAPSGAGKTTVMERLLADDPNFVRSISATTRAARTGEVDAVDYYFRDRVSFDQLVHGGGMLEHASVFGKSYGTPRAPIEAALSEGCDVAMVLDWQGHQAMQRELPGDVVGIYLMVPSRDILERRLRVRGDSEVDIQARMAHAASEEAHHVEFEDVITNDDLEDTLNAIRDIVGRERLLRRYRHISVAQAMSR